jgi:hypothetical protein
MKMALYIIVSVVFGYLIGVMFSNAKNREKYAKKEQKNLKIISEKNATIIKLKNELRITRRKIDALNQGYHLQSKLLSTKEQDFESLLKATKDYSSIKTEHRTLSIELAEKIKIADNKDQIITLLENKIKQISKEEA